MGKTTISNRITPVILCGGSGSRLWPLSRSSFPKQFLALSGDDSNLSLFQEAIVRINAIRNVQVDLGETLIVANEEHRFLALDQLRELNDVKASLLLEPGGRNTAAALTLAAFHALDKNQSQNVDPILIVTPSDQIIKKIDEFIKAILDCIEVVIEDQNKKTIVILGITPFAPETGYGYIQRNCPKGKNNDYVIARFVEKPCAISAQAFLDEGNYLWNSGMLVLRASTWLNALAKYRSDIFNTTKAAWSSRSIDETNYVSFVRPDKSLFTAIPCESIDYAVLEKCTTGSFALKMVELDAGWSDLGAWDAVWKNGKKNTENNVTYGDVILANTKNSLIYSSSRLVSAIGVKDLIIVETADAVLVLDKKNSQVVKAIVSQLEQQKREEGSLNRKVARPWGWYDILDAGNFFKVKRILVHPGASLSLQMHRHRAEHWIVVKGVAEVQNGDKKIMLKENESTFIAQGQKHRLSNPGKDPLEIIEVQSGTYLGEDDIVRIMDNYGRK